MRHWRAAEEGRQDRGCGGGGVRGRVVGVVDWAPTGLREEGKLELSSGCLGEHGRENDSSSRTVGGWPGL